MSQIIGPNRRHLSTPHVPLHHLADRRRIVTNGKHAQRLRSATANERVWIRKRRPQWRAGRGVADETERKRGHLTDFGFSIRRQELCQRFDGVTQADAPQRERGATPDARFRVTEKPEKIRWLRRRDDRRLRARCGDEDCGRWRIRIAQETLIRYLERFPGNVHALKMLAATLLAKSEPKAALAVLRPVLLTANAADAETYAIAGQALLQLGQ